MNCYVDKSRILRPRQRLLPRLAQRLARLLWHRSRVRVGGLLRHQRLLPRLAQGLARLLWRWSGVRVWCLLTIGKVNTKFDPLPYGLRFEAGPDGVLITPAAAPTLADMPAPRHKY